MIVAVHGSIFAVEKTGQIDRPLIGQTRFIAIDAW